MSTCYRSLVLFGLLALALPAGAEKADREKPIRYSATSLDGNEAEQSIILLGKVEIVQGTIVLKADRVVLKQQPDGSYNASATGKPPTRVRADVGRVSADNEQVYLTGNVVAERDADAGKSTITLATEYLHVLPKAEKADTDRRVTITDATGTHVGGAMEADNKARTLKLYDGVTGELRATPK